MRINYDEISPITGNLCVLVEYDEKLGQSMRLCMESGYHTYDGWKKGSSEAELFESNSPEVVKETALYDEKSGLIWYKITMATSDVVLFPDEVANFDSFWKVNSFRDLYEDEEPGNKVQKITKNIAGEPIIQVLDELEESVFGELEFEKAMLEFYNRCAKIEN